MKIRKDDTVIVLCGKDKGKKGKVVKMVTKGILPRAIVEGVNVYKKNLRPNQKMPQGGIIDKELPIFVSKLMIVCPTCSQPARLGKKRMADGKLARTCKKCGELIDKN
ncbi:MAG: 50S ribosomal protein L24 [Caldisericia bacterium]|nr:50S ribosomal protein L24 [Caldisericia bacterium]